MLQLSRKKIKFRLNEQNTQALFISWKTYTLGSLGAIFLITPTFVKPRGTSKGTYSGKSNIISLNTNSWYLRFVNTHSCESSTGFDSLIGIFLEKWNLAPHSSRYICTVCVFWMLFIAIFKMRCFVSRGEFIFYWFSMFHVWSVMVEKKHNRFNSYPKLITNQLAQYYHVSIHLFLASFLILFSFLFHQSLDLTHNIMKKCNLI